MKKRPCPAGVALLALALAVTAALLPAAGSNFVLKADWKGPCRARSTVDVNLGNTTASFIRSCYCQIRGMPPSESELHAWLSSLGAEAGWRRVDVVRTIAQRLGKTVALSYSDPWANNPDLPPAGRKTNKRDIGANIMSFFNCPRGPNCGMDWADNHVEGMDAPSPALAFKGVPGFYCADNPGFWRHELRDAAAAGLDFLMVDVYGPDIKAGRIRTLARALAASSGTVKIALSDDTWTWGQPWFGAYWRDKPNFDDPDRAAAKLYEAKWKPFFTEVPRKYWYLVQGRPLIFFYNANTLAPRNRSSETLKRMKERFRADFGVDPYLVVDQPYFEDARLRTVADGRYIWDPLDHGDSADHISWSRWGTKTIAHAMVRWDSVGRDKPGQIAGAGDRLLKGPERLAKVLDETRDADILVLATWNDLGEGTGINRAYDYWYQGRWLPPDVFIQMLKRAH